MREGSDDLFDIIMDLIGAAQWRIYQGAAKEFGYVEGVCDGDERESYYRMCVLKLYILYYCT